ncbi:HNH endonuclease [Halalkalibacter kiskunsagensis]|uniref:Putative HNH nuclease YajD n=1 Tax=Halalkalibacter kiskunsagensis TaxID=1548599 RepID=A0ABV6K8D6_9BACI
MRQKGILSLSYKTNKLCSCGKLVLAGEVCECKKKAQNPEATTFYKSTRWKKTRKIIINRDGAHCQRCLIKYNIITTSSLEVHHLKPRSIYDGTKGFPDLRYEETNLITLCKSCNTSLGTKGVLDFEWSPPVEMPYVL